MDADIFPARVDDTFNQCERTETPRFLGFLSPQEASIAEAKLKTLHAKYMFFGGYEDAERTFLCCLPFWCDEPTVPIDGITFRFRECDTLSHRDFLGALMSLGITRESVGDILVGCGIAVVFVTEEISDYIISQVSKVGNIGVTAFKGFAEPLPNHGEKIKCSVTSSSLRLDCIVAVLFGMSRSSSVSAIEEGRVSVNSVECQKITKCVAVGDKISLKGKGKLEIVSVSGVSKKGKIIVEYNKYI